MAEMCNTNMDAAGIPCENITFFFNNYVSFQFLSVKVLGGVKRLHCK